MVKQSQVKLPTTAPSLQSLSHSSFPKGVITLVNESNLTKDALKEATNGMLYETGSVGPRWGINWFGTALPGTGPIDGAGMYQGVDGVTKLWVVQNGTFYYSSNDGSTWSTATGATLTAGLKVNGTQANQPSGAGSNYMFLTSGGDPIARWDGSSTLTSFTPISSPTGVTAAKTGLSGTAYTFYYRVAAVNNIGVTMGSTTASIQVSGLRDTWDPTNAGSNYVTLTWSAVTGAVRYDIFLTDNASDDAANNHLYIDSVGNTTYIDHGFAIPNPNSAVPIQNTTGGPMVGELQFVGSRLFGTRDKNNKYRVWWTGSGQFLGYFSDAYDGGYIDLQKGSQFFPVHVEDYRDGKGTPLVTIWCDSVNGQGCVWQMSLDTKTLQNSSYTQPTANKLPGSRGTAAPYSVVNVMNDFVFFNYQAMYNLGSRAQFLNLLSTDESTANIRPTLISQVTPSAAKNVASFFWKDKLFVSVPFNNSTNNNTMVYDTERKAWLPYAYTVGMERMFQYTDANGIQHLLFWKPGDSRLSETSEFIRGDYGQGFAFSAQTGLMPVNPRDRFGFMYVEQAELDFSQPVGNINVELVGIERSKGYGTQKTVTIKPTAAGSSTAGWDTFAWDTEPWDYPGTLTQVYSEASTKRYFMVMRELNAYQWHWTSNSQQSSFVTRQMQVQGTLTDAGLPRQWRLTAH